MTTSDDGSGVGDLTRESLKPLLDLQRVDSRIDRLTQLRAHLPEQQRVDEASAERQAVAAAHAEQGDALQGLMRDQARFEGEVDMLDDKIAHEQNRLYSGEVSSPKELSNIQAELDALRRRKAHVEDQLLEVMERREALESEVGGLKARLDDLDAQLEEATARRDAAAVEIEKDLEELRTERAELAPRLPEEALELYDDLRAKKEGVGAAALVQGVCKGCNVSLSPRALDAIRRTEEAIIRCENCRRILIPL